MTVETHPSDPARNLDADEALAGPVEAAFVTGDACRPCARYDADRQGGQAVEREPPSALGENGNPELATVMKVAKALGLKIGVALAAQ